MSIERSTRVGSAKEIDSSEQPYLFVNEADDLKRDRLHPCARGCGTLIPKLGSKGRPLRYLKGHLHIDKRPYVELKIKKCNGCDEILPIERFSIKRYKSKVTGIVHDRRNSRCKSCGVKENLANPLRNENRRSWRARRKESCEISYWVAGRLTGWRNIDPTGDLNTEYMVRLFNEQHGLCYYTGRPMIFPQKRIDPDGISVEKLDPLGGYRQGNVVFCCFAINTMKGRRTECEFYETMMGILKRKGKI